VVGLTLGLACRVSPAQLCYPMLCFGLRARNVEGEMYALPTRFLCSVASVVTRVLRVEVGR